MKPDSPRPAQGPSQGPAAQGPGQGSARRRPAREPARTARAEALLDAAIAVVADAGLRGLTHRAVDARAQVPAGSTSYYFRTRVALLQAILQRLIDLDAADSATYLPFDDEASVRATDLTRMAEGWARLFAHWLGPGRRRLRARYALYLEGRHHAELHDLLDTASAQFVGGARELLAAAGAPPADADRDGPLLVALLDGLLHDQIIRGGPGVDEAELRRRIEVILGAVLPHLVR
ncbi:TetR family transcriptional regulator [Actinopolymorpha sp. NPDC004070]|uniref:TetR/AcrR family transcriptional regulator n=1 Tax=Actinopolymorpha sp. NPDC004070 TaxID=3154548 RepID=UPI0033B78CE4